MNFCRHLVIYIYIIILLLYIIYMCKYFGPPLAGWGARIVGGVATSGWPINVNLKPSWCHGSGGPTVLYSAPQGWGAYLGCNVVAVGQALCSKNHKTQWEEIGTHRALNWVLPSPRKGPGPRPGAGGP